jgi:hypothetical protein
MRENFRDVYVPGNLGISLARWFEWDIEKVYLLAYSALEEANAHDLARALKHAHDAPEIAEVLVSPLPPYMTAVGRLAEEKMRKDEKAP